MKEPTFLEKLPQARVWVEAGISPGCAGKLVRAGYTSLAALARASREDLLSIRGVSVGTLETLERLLGHPLPRKASPRSAVEDRRPDATEAWRLMMAGAHRLLASEPAAYESRELLELTDRELWKLEEEITRLLTRKRLGLVLRHYLAGLPPGALVPL